MKVLVDTSVWSLALRRRKTAADEDIIVSRLAELIENSLVVMIGPVRQELLSGISQESVYVNLRDKLGNFNDFPIYSYNYETAASYYNICRSNGVQGSHIDFLICAVAVSNDFLIFTTDDDYTNYARHLPIRMY